MDLNKVQEGIFDDVPLHGRFMFFQLRHNSDAAQIKQALQALVEHVDGKQVVLGLGESSLSKLNVDHLEPLLFASYDTRGIQVPSTPAALWFWLRGSDLGELTLKAQALYAVVDGAYEFEHTIDSFKYQDGRDLTGYEDGTENPEGDDAFDIAFTKDGGSYVAIQQWQHDLAFFKGHSQAEQDNMIGRRLNDNEEIGDAPESAHVKRTEQEGFEPETFLLRRSMAYGEGVHAGLVFQAFANTPESFNKMMAKMVGEDDGIVDALFNFTRPVTGAFFWCPPMKDGKLNLANIC